LSLSLLSLSPAPQVTTFGEGGYIFAILLVDRPSSAGTNQAPHGGIGNFAEGLSILIKSDAINTAESEWLPTESDVRIMAMIDGYGYDRIWMD